MAERTLPAEIREALAKIERAEQMVFALCEGKRRWTMSVPARPNDDPDLVIDDGLNAGRQAIQALIRERDEALGRVEAAERALEEARADTERLRKPVRDAGGHISWRRHRHGSVSKDPETRERQNGLLDDWIRAARNVEGEDGE